MTENILFAILIGFAIVLVIRIIFFKKIKYAISGFTLIAIGLLDILYQMNKTQFNIGKFPIFHTIGYFFVMFAAKDLLIEGIRERESIMKFPSIFFALILTIGNTIATIQALDIDIINNIISIPAYPLIFNSYVFIFSGIFLFIGIFTLLRTDD